MGGEEGGEEEEEKRAAVEMIGERCQNFFKCSSMPPRPSGAPALLACLVFHLFLCLLTSSLQPALH